MGLQQQRIQLQREAQALQTGQYTQQTAQAEAQASQQAMGERQQLQGVMKTGVRPDTGQSIYNDQNEVDPDKLSDYATKNLPLIGQAVAQNVLKTKNDKAQLSLSVANLKDKYRDDLSGITRSFMNNPKATSQDLTDAYQTYARQNPDAAQVVLDVGNMAKHIDVAQGMKAKNDMLIHLSQQLQPSGRTAEQQAPSVAIYQGAKGVQPFQSNPYAPGGVQNVGNPLGPQGVAPQMTTPPGGIPTPYVPGGGVGSPSRGANAGGPTPTDQDLQRHNVYETNLNDRVSIASDLLPRLKMTETAADAIRTGAGTGTRAGIAKSLQALGAPQGLVDAVAGGNLADVQEAEKLLFQTTFSGLRQSMQGDPARVAEFQAADKVFPNVNTDPRARQQILGFMSDQGQRDFAEQRSLNQAKKSGTFNPATWQADYQQQLRGGKVPGVPASQIPGPLSGGSAPPQRIKTRDGMVKSGPNKGKKVTEYSDGTREYE